MASRSHTARVTCPVVALSAQVAGVQGGIGGDLLDGSHQALCGSALTQVFEQHHAAPERAHGVGQPLPMMSKAEPWMGSNMLG